jgi:hypothetical protein
MREAAEDLASEGKQMAAKDSYLFGSKGRGNQIP